MILLIAIFLWFITVLDNHCLPSKSPFSGTAPHRQGPDLFLPSAQTFKEPAMVRCRGEAAVQAVVANTDDSVS